TRATPAPDIDTLSLHDALPIYAHRKRGAFAGRALDRNITAHDQRQLSGDVETETRAAKLPAHFSSSLHVRLEQLRQCRCVHTDRSEEHTSELQSRENLVCRLLL